MSASVESYPGHMTTGNCAACSLALLTDQLKTCTTCRKNFCNSCYSMKTKLDLSAPTQTPSTNGCQSCDNIIQLKTNRHSALDTQHNLTQVAFSKYNSINNNSSIQISTASSNAAKDSEMNTITSSNGAKSSSRETTGSAGAAKDSKLSTVDTSSGTKVCPHLSQTLTFHSNCCCHHGHHDHSLLPLTNYLENIPTALQLCDVVKPGQEKISKHPCTMRPTAQHQQEQQLQQPPTPQHDQQPQVVAEQQPPILNQQQQYQTTQFSEALSLDIDGINRLDRNKNTSENRKQSAVDRNESLSQPSYSKEHHRGSSNIVTSSYDFDKPDQRIAPSLNSFTSRKDSLENTHGPLTETVIGGKNKNERPVCQEATCFLDKQKANHQNKPSMTRTSDKGEEKTQVVSNTSTDKMDTGISAKDDDKDGQIDKSSKIWKKDGKMTSSMEITSPTGNEQSKGSAISTEGKMIADTKSKHLTSRTTNNIKKLSASSDSAQLAHSVGSTSAQHQNDVKNVVLTSGQHQADDKCYLDKKYNKLEKQVKSETTKEPSATKQNESVIFKSPKRNTLNGSKRFTRKSELRRLEKDRKSLYKGSKREPNALTILTCHTGTFEPTFRFSLYSGGKGSVKKKKKNTSNAVSFSKQAPVHSNIKPVSTSTAKNKEVDKPKPSGSKTTNSNTYENKGVNDNLKGIGKPKGKTVKFKPELYHQAFQRLREEHTGVQTKCSSCGRSECSSENLQSMKKLLKSARENGYQVHDVTPDGNCMFAAVVDQLSMYGDNHYDARTLREAAVLWLLDNPYTESGTPKSEFLSEDWHHYIDRMSKEGEWGDHMILGAIVEVVGCTIRVMSPTDGEPHWTTLEPQGPNTAGKDKHLILGHIGEFHYTSLRPTGMHVEQPESPKATWPGTEDTPLTRIEGKDDSLLSVFRDTYICEESDLPVIHLSYLLKTIIPISCLQKAAVYMSEYTDEMMATLAFVQKDGVNLELIGTQAEGVHVPELEHLLYSGQNEKFIPQVVISILSIDEACIVAEENYYPNGKLYMLQETSAGSTKLLFTCLTSGFSDKTVSPICLSGPSVIDFLTNVPNLYFKKVIIFAITCKCWPRAAIPWRTRQRLEGWPSVEFVQSVVNEGCLVILKVDKHNTYSGTDFEFFFGLIERRIFKEVASQHQKHAYIMFRALCQQTLMDFEKMSRPIKVTFLYACEVIPLDHWMTRQGACILYMLDQLSKGLNAGNVPDYFIPSKNVLDHLKESYIQDVHSRMCLLQSQPLLFLQQIQEACPLQIKGEAILDSVSADIPNFKQHRSPQKSMLDAFVPATIQIAKVSIKKRKYKEGLSILSNAFEDRLSVSTCNDSISYQMFLTGALSDLDMRSSIWFATYADHALTGQLSVSMVQELCGHIDMIKIKQLLPGDVAGKFAETEIPPYLFPNIGELCLDFAKFLYSIEKSTAAQPVLHYCHERYKQQQQQRADRDTHSASGGVDVEDNVMLEVFVAMLKIYKQQGQADQFKNMIPDAEALCQRMNTTEANATLLVLYSHANQKPNNSLFMNMTNNTVGQMQIKLKYFYNWPEC